MVRHSFQSILSIRVHGEKLHAARTQLAIRVHQPRHVSIVDRAFGAHKNDHDRLLVLGVTQLPSFACRVAETEILEKAAGIGLVHARA